jgi:3-oxoadipate enol-lactonase
MTLAHDTTDADGPALVLLHSTVCDRRMWDPQWPTLADVGYRVVRCDFRGFGETPLPDRRHNDAEDVLDLLDTLGIEQATLIASSYGGQVALELAARHPDRVSAMALLCSGLPGHQPTDVLRAFGEREDELLETGDVEGAVELNLDTWLGPDADESVREKVRGMQRQAFDIQLAASEGAGRNKVDIDLAAIKAPGLAVSGGYDLPDFRHIAAQLPSLLPNTRHLELPWAGHLPSLERPTTVTDLLTGFLRETVPTH